MRTLLAFLLAATSWAAIPAGTVWSIRSGATSGNLNPGGFDTGAAFSLTNCTATSANVDAPVVSCSGYTFLTRDQTHWVYTVSNTNGEIRRGLWQITSVSGGNATLNAAVGAGSLHNATARTWTANTSSGIATVASPTAITLGINYGLSTAAVCALTDLVIDATTNTDVTSSACPLGANFIGNSIKVASGTGFTVQTAFIMSNPSGSIARLDKSAGTLGSTGGVGKLAGSISLNSSDDAIFELGVAGNDFLVESGSYTIGGTVTIAAAGGSQNPIRIIGYSSGPGVCSSTTTKPILTTTTLITLGANWDMACMTANGSSSSGTVTSGNNSRFYFSKFVNTSTTANAAALTLGTEAWAFGIEAVSYRGRAVSTAANAAQIHGCYLHDSDIGLRIATTTAYATVTDCTIAGNYTAAISVASASTSPILIDHCTLYGAENNLGIGVSIVTGVTDLRITSSIIKGFTTGVSHADAQTVGFDAYNFYHDNTTDATNWHLGPGSVSGTDPAFTAVTQQTGTGATSSTNMLTAASGTPFSSVVDNQDFVTLTSGSGAGFATGKYLITAHTDNTVTVSSNITSSGSGSSIAWEVTLGHNFAIGAALKALGYPGVFPGGLTTGYLDPGAVQRQEGGAGGTRIY